MKKMIIITPVVISCLLLITIPAFAGGNKKKLEAENAQLKVDLETSRSRISELEGGDRPVCRRIRDLQPSASIQIFVRIFL